MIDQASIEAVARIIDPSSWRVMDSYLEQAKRQYKGQDVGWPEDQFKHKESMAKAREILAALQAAPFVDLEVEEQIVKIIEEEVDKVGYAKRAASRIVHMAAPVASPTGVERRLNLLLEIERKTQPGESVMINITLLRDLANALSSRKGGTPDEFEASVNAELVGLIRETAARIIGGNCTFADDDLKAIEARLTTTARERDDLRHRLDEAADQFAFYADEHAKKGTVAGDAKACTNRAWSVACAKPALTKEPSHGE